MFFLRHLQHAARTINQTTLPGSILPSLTFEKPTTQIPDRLFGLISVAYARLHLSNLLFKACMLVTSTSYKTGMKLV